MVIDLVASVIGDPISAKMVVERLNDEGFLHLGYGEPDIDRVVNKFKDTYGTTKVSKQDRFAANRLVSKYGAQSICGIIELMAASSQDKYAPVIGSVAQLEEKWVHVLNFVRKANGSETIQV